jgi:hypothetical protein
MTVETDKTKCSPKPIGGSGVSVPSLHARHAKYATHSVLSWAISCLLILGSLLILSACRVDRDYFLFVHGEAPDGFSVSTLDLSGMTVCDLGDETAFTVSLSALDDEGLVDTTYEGVVNIGMVRVGGTQVGVLPLSSPAFEEGAVTVSNFSIVGEIVPGEQYVIRVTDSEDETLTGSSDPFTANIREVDHFTVSGIPNILSSGDSFNLYVYAVDQNDATFSQFDGTVDLVISDGWSIAPETVTFDPYYGYGTASVTVTGSGEFEIEAVVSATQDPEVACLGGLEAGGGGGGDGGGGGSASEPSSLECVLSGPGQPVLLGSDFTLSLSMTKLDDDDDAYSSFSGSASLSAPGSGLDPTSMTLSSLYGSGTYSMSSSGDFEVTATVSDDDSDLTCNCSVDMSVVTGVALYGDIGAELTTWLETEYPDVNFQTISAISNQDQLAGFTTVICNFAGDNWYNEYYGSPLSGTAASVLYDYWQAGNPILIAHDAPSQDLIDNLLNPVWGVTSTTQQRIETSTTFSFINTTPWKDDIPSLTTFEEKYCDGITHGGSATEVAGIQGTSYALILATSSGANAVYLSEALQHGFDGETQVAGGGTVVVNETQWIESNPQLVRNILDWILP